MKKENTQAAIAKKKKNIRTTCYVSLVVLVILLFLPMMLRVLVKDKEPDEEKPKDVVLVLTCNKIDESISSTFLNDVPQNILYKIKGDYTVVSTPDEMETSGESNIIDNGVDDNNLDSTEETIEPSSNLDDTPPTSIDGNNLIDKGTDTPQTFLDLIRPYSSISYDTEDDLTSARVEAVDLAGRNDYQSYFSTIDAQSSYYTSLGFSCTRMEL